MSAFGFTVRPIILGELAPLWDADGFFAPYYTLVADFARQGKLLLWNPWTNGGSPDYIDPQIGALSPIVVLSALLTGGGSAGYRAHWLGIWLLGGLGMLMMGRRLGAPPSLAAAVALGFTMSGPFTGNAQHPSWLYSLSLLPWALWRLDIALERSDPLAAAQAGALWGVSAIGGYPAMVLISAGVLVLWPLVRPPQAAADIALSWKARAAGARARAAARQVALCLGVGVLVLLPAALPILIEGGGFTDRSGALPRAEAIASNALHPLALLTVFSPYLATLPPRLLWPDTDVSSVGLYFGAVPLLLASYAIASRPRDVRRWYLLGAALLFLGCALGDALPLRGVMYDLLPPTRYFRHASIFRLGTLFCLCLLALLGACDLRAADARAAFHLRPLMVAVGLALLAAVSYRALGRMLPVPTAVAGDTHAIVMFGGLVAAGVLAASTFGGRRRLSLLIVLPALAIYDARAAFELASTIGTPATTGSWRDLDARRVRSLDLLASGLQRLPVSNSSTGFGPGPTNKNLLVKVPVLFGYAPLNNSLLRRWLQVPTLAQAALRPDRVFFAARAVHTPPTAHAFDVFEASARQHHRMPLLLHNRAAMTSMMNRPGDASLPLNAAIVAAPAVTPLPVNWRSYLSDSLEFDVQAPANGWLLLTDRWARGWRAEVDGKSTEVRGANFLFRGLRIQRGRHTVRMSYHPFGVPGLIILSWSALGVVALAGVLRRVRRAVRSVPCPVTGDGAQASARGE